MGSDYHDRPRRGTNPRRAVVWRRRRAGCRRRRAKPAHADERHRRDRAGLRHGPAERRTGGATADALRQPRLGAPPSPDRSPTEGPRAEAFNRLAPVAVFHPRAAIYRSR